jgi:hypothetical protein
LSCKYISVVNSWKRALRKFAYVVGGVVVVVLHEQVSITR